MNFPDAQLTGALGELAVTQLFTQWRWSVGRHLIDSGYDLCVTPDHARYQSFNFYVQVKSTERVSGSRVTALVDRARLRMYAEAVQPVFVVRVTSDGELFWTDAQEWARANSDQLVGAGAATVTFAHDRRLSNREGFERHLIQLLPAARERATALENFSERRRHLNALNPRVGVRLTSFDGRTEHELFARDQSFEAQFSFNPVQTPDNLKNLREAIEFGLPRPVEIEDFNLTGSPMFEQMGTGRLSKGTLTISRSEEDLGAVQLYPGLNHSVTAQELIIEADLFSGTKGFAITNEARDSIFDLDIRASVESSIGLTANLRFRSGLSNKPVRDINALRPLADWCDQIVLRQALYLELCFKEVRAPLSITQDRIEVLLPFVYWARTLSRLHRVAKVLGSNIALPEDFALSDKDIEDIDMTFSLLRGDRLKIGVGPVEFEPARSMDGVDPDSLYTTTTMAVSLFGQPLGELPVGIEYVGYVLEAIPGTKKVRLSKGENGHAWLSHAEQDDHGNWVNRRALIEGEPGTALPPVQGSESAL